MTKEEAIKELKELEYYNRPFDNSAEAAEVATRKAQAVDMAIKALEQTELNSSYNSINSIKTELNELDCISRQSVLEKAYKIAGYDRNAYVVDVADIEALPSVSTEKTGRWIKRENEFGLFECSVCKGGYIDQPTCMGKPMFKYCPNCGAKMGGGKWLN